MKRLLLSITLLLFALPAFAETYVWEDAQGVLNFAEDLGKVPKQYRKKARVLGEEEPPPAQGQGIAEKPPVEAPVAAIKAQPEAKPAAKDIMKELYGWKDGAAWKAAFAEVNADLKGYEKQLVEQRGRLKDTTGMSRNDFLTIQNTLKSLEYSVLNHRKKLTVLKEEATKAGVPAELME